ncbi:unnamed protein product, partial [Choristocarpus tenellus]
VRNLNNKHDQATVTIFATVKPLMYIHFPDLDPDKKGKLQKLQFGYCYMPDHVDQIQLQSRGRDKGKGWGQGLLLGSSRGWGEEPEVVRPLRVRNVSSENLYLTCIPNLRKQCFVFALANEEQSPAESMPSAKVAAIAAGESGAQASAVSGVVGSGKLNSVGSLLTGVPVMAQVARQQRRQAVDLPLNPGEEMTLFIGLRPHVPNEAYVTGECRELVGGVRVLGHNKSLKDIRRKEDEKQATKAGDGGNNGLGHKGEAGTTVSATGPLGVATTATMMATRTSGIDGGVGGRGSGEGGGREYGAVDVETLVSRMVPEKLFELTVKFVGTVGVSILRVHPLESRFSLLLPAPTPTPSNRSQGQCGGSSLHVSGVRQAAQGPGAWGKEGEEVGGDMSVGGTKGNSGRIRRTIFGSLELENATKSLPLEYRLVSGQLCHRGIATAMKRLESLPMGGVELVILGEEGGTLAPSGSICIRFCILLHAFRGVFRQAIRVENLSTPERDMALPLEHIVQVFSDDGEVVLHKGISDEEERREALPRLNATKLCSPSPDLSTPGGGGGMKHGINIDPATTANSAGVLFREDGDPLPGLEAVSFSWHVAISTAHLSTSAPAVGDTDLANIWGDGDSGRSCGGDGVREFSSSPQPPTALRRFRILAPPAVSLLPPLNLSVNGTQKELEEAGDFPIWEGVGEARGSAEGQGHGKRKDKVRNVSPLGSQPQVLSTAAASAAIEVGEEVEGGVERGEGRPVSSTNEDVSGVEGAQKAGREVVGLLGVVCGASDRLFGHIGGEATRQAIHQGEEGRSVRDDSRSGLECILKRCGPMLKLPPGGSTRFRVAIQPGAFTAPLLSKDVTRGEAIPFDGIVAFARHRAGVAAWKAGQGADKDVATSRQGGDVTMEAIMAGDEKGEDEEGQGGNGSLSPPPFLDFCHCGAPGNWTKNTKEGAGTGNGSGYQLVKMVKVSGEYCHPTISVAGPTVVDLGKVGHTASKHAHQLFEVKVENLCSMWVPVGLKGLPKELELLPEPALESTLKGSSTISHHSPMGSVDHRDQQRQGGANIQQGGSRGVITQEANSNVDRTTPKHAVLLGGQKRQGEGGARVVWIPPWGVAVMAFRLQLPWRVQSWAGDQSFGFGVTNLADPSALPIAVDVRVHVVTQLISLLGLPPPAPLALLSSVSPDINTLHGSSSNLGEMLQVPESKSAGIENGASTMAAAGCVRLPSLVVPPLPGSAGQCKSSFSIKNTQATGAVSVCLTVSPAPSTEGVLSLAASLFPEETSGMGGGRGGEEGGVSHALLLPGEVMVVRVKCNTLFSSRLTSELLLASKPGDGWGSSSPESGGAGETSAGSGVGKRPVSMTPNSTWIGALHLHVSEIPGDVEGGMGPRVGSTSGKSGGSSGDRGWGHDVRNQEGKRASKGLLTESVAVIGSLVPGPTFRLSRSVVELMLQPGGSGGGGGSIGVVVVRRPLDHSEHPESFFVENITSVGPVRFRLRCIGATLVAGGVRLP